MIKHRVGWITAILVWSQTLGGMGQGIDASKAWQLLGAGQAGEPIQPIQAEQSEAISEGDKRHGAFALVQTVSDPGTQSALGLVVGQQRSSWPVRQDWSIHFWLKISQEPEPMEWLLALTDQEGNRATVPLGNRARGGEWRQFSLPLAIFSTEPGFDFSALQTIQLESRLPQGTEVYWDHIYFYHPGKQERVLVLD